MTSTTPNAQPVPALPAGAKNALWVAYVVLAVMVGLMVLEQWQPLIALCALSGAGVAGLLITNRRSERPAPVKLPVRSSLGHARETRVA